MNAQRLSSNLLTLELSPELLSTFFHHSVSIHLNQGAPAMTEMVNQKETVIAQRMITTHSDTAEEVNQSVVDTEKKCKCEGHIPCKSARWGLQSQNRKRRVYEFSSPSHPMIPMTL
jgi:hypothetical protein